MNKKELEKKYNHLEVENGKYKFWLENEFFKACPKSNKPHYTIVIPPPNVTGKLHLGHAWDTTLQDILIRRKRMQGYDALWLPGMDHAGIATQAKVDAKLLTQGISRYDLGREKFLEIAWEWKQEYAKFIRSQWAKLGLSLDYSRERFTLDEGLNDAVKEVFVKLYNEGIIYRGEKIINWDPHAQTALSNIEVEHKEIEGYFYYFKYIVENSDEYLEVATTRPETMFGDVAVAVHPKDKRYKHIVGKRVINPANNKAILVITDDYVDMEFGTGAVKITPAHDPNDFEIGNRHDLERAICINQNGSMNELALKYNGLDRFECRKQLVDDLKSQNLVVKIEKHIHSVGHSERTGVIVEPYLSKQWFVNMEPLAKEVLKVQKNNSKDKNGINFIPERFEKTFLNWMENVYDWCISRQLWWGHRIPAWYHKETNEVYVGIEPPKDIENYKQDEDVLDTWFSSALWPFSTLGWPDEQSEDYKTYFANDCLVTGYDIIFFWVARMYFQSLKFTEKAPFKDVLIHGLVRDESGRKMSKSFGNGVDPMDVIAKYGADSLRYFLTTNSAPGQDLRYIEEKVGATWNFINKIWNASRFVLMNIKDVDNTSFDIKKLNISDKWILKKLNDTITNVDYNYDKYDFGEAARHLYNFTWNDFCDWYIEMSKLPLYGDNEESKTTTLKVLVYVLDKILKLLHPFMPFVTEEIYQSLPHKEKSITISAWPKINEEYNFTDDVMTMNIVQEIIKAVRNIRSEVNAPISKKIEMIIKTSETSIYKNKAYIEKFCNVSKLVINPESDIKEELASAVVTNAEILIPLKGLIDIDKEIERLEAELLKLENEVKRCEKMLANPNFINKAPKEKVLNEKSKLKDYQTKYDIIQKRINELKQ